MDTQFSFFDLLERPKGEAKSPLSTPDPVEALDTNDIAVSPVDAEQDEPVTAPHASGESVPPPADDGSAENDPPTTVATPVYAAYECGDVGAPALRPSSIPTWWPKPVTGKAREHTNEQALALASLVDRRGLHQMLTDEMRSALAGYTGTGGVGSSLNQYYTPVELCRAMWDVLGRLGARTQRVLEPSAGIGPFMATAPAGSHFVSVEMDPASAQVQKALFPSKTIAWPHLTTPPLSVVQKAAQSYVETNGLQGDGAVEVMEEFSSGARFGTEKFYATPHKRAGEEWHVRTVGVAPRGRGFTIGQLCVLHQQLLSDSKAGHPWAPHAINEVERALRDLEINPSDTTRIESSARHHSRETAQFRVVPEHTTHETAFENYLKLNHQGSFDLVIGNPPFGIRGGTIRLDGRNITRAEEYFLRRGIQVLEPGGYLAMVVPSGFMQTLRARTTRRAISLDAEIVTAFRLPSETFAAAGTGVATDLVVFRRRPHDVSRLLRVLSRDQLLATAAVDEDFVDGRYFDSHPDHVLGRMAPGWRERAGMGHDFEVQGSLKDAIIRMDEWSPDSRHNPVTLEIIKNRLLAAGTSMESWFDRLREAKKVKLAEISRREEIPEIAEMGAAAVDAVEAGHTVEAFMAGRTLRKNAEQAVRQFLSDHGHPAKIAAIHEWMEISRGAVVDDTIKGTRRALNLLCGAVRQDGTLSDRIVGKVDRVAYSSVHDAVSALSAESSEITVRDVRSLLGSENQATDAEIEAAFEAAETIEPCGEGVWMPSDAFYTGDLWARHDRIQDVLRQPLPADRADRHRRQLVRLLEIIDPVSLDDVEVTINSPFVPVDVIDAFMHSGEMGDRYSRLAPNERLTLGSGLYSVVDEADGKEKEHRIKSLVVRVLNRHQVAAKDEDDVYVLNAKFSDWLLASPYREAVEERYNRTFRRWHNDRSAFSEAPIVFDGINPTRRLNQYHNASVRWAVAVGRGVSASDVGVGKTTEAIMTAKYLSQKGDIRNPAFVVPKSVAAKWCQEIEAWFPGADVLLIGETHKRSKDGSVKPQSDNQEVCRQKFVSLALNNYDFVVITEEAWNRIDVDPIQKWDLLSEDFDVRRGEALGNRGSKAVQKAREQYEQYVGRRDFERREDTLYVSDLSLEFIVFDEIHRYKNLFAPRNRFGHSPKFLGGSGESIRAFDTYLKLKALRADNPQIRIFGASATPAKNSPLEVYAIMSLVDPEPLTSAGIRSPEDFLDRFVDFQTKPTLDLEGKVETALVTTGFKNLGELRRLMAACFKRTTAADVGLKIPDTDVERDIVQMTAGQRRYFNELRESLNDERPDVHIFSILASMAKAGVDMTLVDAAYRGEPSPKVDKLVQHVSTHQGIEHGGHIVFCDHIDVHERIQAQLIAAGVPSDQIAIVNAKTAPTSGHRLRISELFNAGKKSIVIGNTATLGEGQDFQVNTGFIHHLDLPWDPDTLHQRNGRGVRQGNDRASVQVRIYFLAGSNDAYRYETIMAKKQWKDVLWGDSDTAENPCNIAMPDRREMIIMLSEDPDAARAAFEADDVAKEASRNALARRIFNRDSALLWTMVNNHRALGGEGESGAKRRLESRMKVIRESLIATPWIDEQARQSLAAAEPVAVLESTGETVTPRLILDGKLSDFGSREEYVLRGLARGQGGLVSMQLGKWAKVGAPTIQCTTEALPAGSSIKLPGVSEEEAIRDALSKPHQGYADPSVHSIVALAQLPETLWMPHMDAVKSHIVHAYSHRYSTSKLIPLRRDEQIYFTRLGSYAQLDANVGLVIPTHAVREEIMQAAIASWRTAVIGYRQHNSDGLVTKDRIDLARIMHEGRRA